MIASFFGTLFPYRLANSRGDRNEDGQAQAMDQFFMVRKVSKAAFQQDLQHFDDFWMEAFAKPENHFVASPGMKDHLGDYPALRHTAELSKDGRGESQQIVCFETPKSYYVMVGGSPKPKAEASTPVLEQIMTSFHCTEEAP